ncbi:MAG: nitrophenyl compound nitroreductase subunit ArsF family protein [Candidatus Gottesmanbacteria bacterium]|nr:nitrophenyl compound nitroreductase subunit ArsF family protein [Candidatus Gottesmanbacteria bacterium]
MKHKPVLISIAVVLVLLGGFILYKRPINSKDTRIINPSTQLANTASSAPMSVAPAEKIEVVHFHGTQQCWSCITVGEYALTTIKDKFPEEYRSGKIIYKDINGELPENKEIVLKYQARGSSLFINTVKNTQDNIQEEIKVWYLVNDKEKFIEYFEGRLKDLLGT